MEPVIIVTGLSGSGKSLAARCFEDLGYFCIDNLPVTLIPVLLELIHRGRAELTRIALVVDVREGELLRDLPRTITELRARRVPVRVVYFESTDEALVRRFSETRRPHPLDRGGGLADAIARERETLRDVRDLADRLIDTSRFNAHELRSFLRKEFEPAAASAPLAISIVSFGFKHGLPPDADMVFDVRFVINPFFVEELKGMTGLNEPVIRFLEERTEYVEFLRRAGDLLEFLIPGFIREGKSYLTIAVGCTGGRHRSVAAAQRLRERLQRCGHPARVTHRDIEKE